MKSAEVLQLLDISRATLTKYVKDERIRVDLLDNGRYLYNREDVYRIFHCGVERLTVIYVLDAADQLPNSIDKAKLFCLDCGFEVGKILTDTAYSELSSAGELLCDLSRGRVERLVLANTPYIMDTHRTFLNFTDLLATQYDCELYVAEV